MIRAGRLLISTISLTLLLVQPSQCQAEEIGKFEQVIMQCAEQLDSPVTKEEWDKIRQSADLSYKAEYYRDSLPLYKKAIFTFERRSDLAAGKEAKVDDLSVSLASNYFKLGNFDKARETYVKLLPNDLSTEPADFPRFSIQVLNGLAGIDLEQGYYTDVTARCELAKRIASKSNVLNSESLKTNILMATAQYRQGNLVAAEAQYKDILKQAEGLGADGKGVRADVLEGLSNIHLKRYDIARAREEADQALVLRKDVFGEESLEAASSLLTVANCVDYSEPFNAKQMRLKALSVQTGLLGNDANPIIGRTLLSLASHKSYRSYSSGEHFTQAALHSVDGILDPESPFVADCLVNLATFQLYQDRLKPARETIKQAIAIQSKLFSPDSLPLAESLDMLGNIELRDAIERNRGLALGLGQSYSQMETNPVICPEAEAAITKAIEIANRTFGQDNVDSAIYMCDLAYVKGAAQKGSDAESLAAKALAIIEHSSGDKHDLTATARSAMLFAYRKEKKYKEAFAVLSLMLETQLKDTGVYNETVADLIKQMRNLERDQHAAEAKNSGNADARVTYPGWALRLFQLMPEEYTGFQKSFEFIKGRLENETKRTINLRSAGTSYDQVRAQEKLYGNDSPRIAGNLMTFADEQTEANNLDEALKTYERILQIDEAGYGDNHPMLLEPLEKYSKLLEKMGKHKEAEALISRKNAILARNNNAKP